MKSLLFCIGLLTVQSIKLNLNEQRALDNSLFDYDTYAELHNQKMDDEKSDFDEMLQVHSMVQSHNHAGRKDRAMALDVGGKMYEALKESNSTELSKVDFMAIIKKWFRTHGRVWNDDVRLGFERSFDLIDKDNSTSVDKKEIFQWLFNYMDTDGDGVWNAKELQDYVQAMAKHTGRNLTVGWKQKIHDTIERIDDGVTAEELEKVLSEDGKDITSLKEVVDELSTPENKSVKIKGKLDKYELMERLLGAWDYRAQDYLMNQTEFIWTCRSYLLGKNHTWNATDLDFYNNIWNMINEYANKNGSLSKKDITGYIFSWFDKNGDHQLNSTEIKSMFVEYAVAMNRTMNNGWWDEVSKGIKEIEAGVSPDELWKHLEKENQRITDIRKAVISLSDPEDDNTSPDGQPPNNNGTQSVQLSSY